MHCDVGLSMVTPYQALQCHRSIFFFQAGDYRASTAWIKPRASASASNGTGMRQVAPLLKVTVRAIPVGFGRNAQPAMARSGANVAIVPYVSCRSRWRSVIHRTRRSVIARRSATTRIPA